MPGTSLDPDLARSLDKLHRRVERLERRTVVRDQVQTLRPITATEGLARSSFGVSYQSGQTTGIVQYDYGDYQENAGDVTINAAGVANPNDALDINTAGIYAVSFLAQVTVASGGTHVRAEFVYGDLSTTGLDTSWFPSWTLNTGDLKTSVGFSWTGYLPVLAQSILVYLLPNGAGSPGITGLTGRLWVQRIL